MNGHPDREDLAAVVLPHLGAHAPGTVGRAWAEQQAMEIADAILAAGWKPPPPPPTPKPKRTMAEVFEEAHRISGW